MPLKSAHQHNFRESVSSDVNLVTSCQFFINDNDLNGLTLTMVSSDRELPAYLKMNNINNDLHMRIYCPVYTASLFSANESDNNFEITFFHKLWIILNH